MIAHILALDIGGTNPRLGMLKVEGNHYQLLKQELVPRGARTIVPHINEFLTACAERRWTTNVCCACATGLIENNCSRNPTNTRLQIIDTEIIDGTAIDHVLVINDFKAIGEAIASIDLNNLPKTIAQLPGFAVGDDLKSQPKNKPNPAPNGNRGVIGPGTGLGVSHIPFVPGFGYHVSASEGGHSGVPTRGDKALLLEFIRKKLDTNHLGMEALASGQGIRHTIDFFLSHPRAFIELAEREYPDEFAAIKQKRGITDKSLRDAMTKENKHPGTVDVARMVAEAVEKNPKAQVTMRLFMEFLGSAAQAVALHGTTTGGLFIAGGIPAKNRELLMNGDFMRAFCDNWKPNIQEMLQSIPVYLVDDYDISFTGCARAAHNAFRKEMSEEIVWQ